MERVFNSLKFADDEDTLFFNYDDTTIAFYDVPFYSALDTFEEEIGFHSLRRDLEDRIHFIYSTGMDIAVHNPDTLHIVDPYFQTFLNEHHELAIGDTVSKTINECTELLVIDNMPLVTNLRTNDFNPPLDLLNDDAVEIIRNSADCGNCDIGPYQRSIAKFSEYETIQFIPYKLDNPEDTMLEGYSIHWKINGTVTSTSIHPTIDLPYNSDFDVSVAVNNGEGCWSKTTASYKKKSCTAANNPICEFKPIPNSNYNLECDFENLSRGVSSTIVTSTWNYGDGMPATTLSGIADGNVVFTQYKKYEVKLTVKDADGCESSKSMKITVSNKEVCCKKDVSEDHETDFSVDYGYDLCGCTWSKYSWVTGYRIGTKVTVQNGKAYQVRCYNIGTLYKNDGTCANSPETIFRWVSDEKPDNGKVRKSRKVRRASDATWGINSGIEYYAHDAEYAGAYGVSHTHDATSLPEKWGLEYPVPCN